MTTPADTRDPLRRARSDALAHDLTLRGGQLSLTRDTYRGLAFDGWTRRAVDLAVDDLVRAGRATLDHLGGILVVRLVDPPEEART